MSTRQPGPHLVEGQPDLAALSRLRRPSIPPPDGQTCQKMASCYRRTLMATLGRIPQMHVGEIYERYVAEAVRPLVVEERRRGNDLPTTDWTETTLGFFYRLGAESGFDVETNRETVRRVDPKRYEDERTTYQEPPKEYLLD